MSDEAAKSLAALPGAPDPNLPVPRDAVDGFDLARYARVSAELAERARPREVIFAEQGTTEPAWTQIELTWLLRVATALLQGDASLAAEYDRLLVEAQDALGANEHTLPMERYATLVAQIESGRDPIDVYAEHGLTLASAARQGRRHNARHAADPALAERFRLLVEQAKAL